MKWKRRESDNITLWTGLALIIFGVTVLTLVLGYLSYLVLRVYI